MKCPEISPLVPRFFDGELDGALMRKIALHITRCADCERELRSLEKLQGLMVRHLSAEVGGFDLDSIWTVVSAQIEETPLPWTQRLGTWWEELDIWSPLTVWPALAAAAGVFLAVNLWTTQPNATGSGMVRHQGKEITQEVAAVNSNLMLDAMNEIDNSAVFESIVGGVDSLMVEPKTQTAVIWINDNGDFR